MKRLRIREPLYLLGGLLFSFLSLYLIGWINQNHSMRSTHTREDAIIAGVVFWGILALLLVFPFLLRLFVIELVKPFIFNIVKSTAHVLFSPIIIVVFIIIAIVHPWDLFVLAFFLATIVHWYGIQKSRWVALVIYPLTTVAITTMTWMLIYFE